MLIKAKEVWKPALGLNTYYLLLNTKARLRRAFQVPPVGIEPTSSEPESDILSIELRRRQAKNNIYFGYSATIACIFRQAIDFECYELMVMTIVVTIYQVKFEFKV